MNTFYIPLLLLSVFGYAASGTCEVLDRIGKNKTIMRKIIGFVSTMGLAVWLLWIASFFLAVKWWHAPILFILSIVGAKLFDWVTAFVGLAGDGISRTWLCLTSLCVVPMLIWTVYAMYEACVLLYS